MKHISYLTIFVFFILFSAIPFIFVPGQGFSIVPSRYLYFGSAGFALLLTLIGNMVLNLKRKKITILVTASFFLISILGALENFNHSQELKMSGSIRKSILTSIKKFYPTLPQKVVFYTQSDSSYFGLPDNIKILPFQSGLGQTLLLWYFSGGSLPAKFFENNFLWNIDSQGYKEIGGIGFGYFRDFFELQSTVSQNKLTLDSIIAFSWNARENKLTDISSQIRSKIDNLK